MKKEFLTLLKGILDNYRIDFGKEYIDSILESGLYKDEIEKLKNIIEFRSHKTTIKSLYRDLFEHTQVPKDKLLELKIEYSCIEYQKNPTLFIKHFIYKISHKDKFFYYFLIPSLHKKYLSYDSFIYLDDKIRSVWGDGVKKNSILKRLDDPLKSFLK